jgi:hypothetical protein
MHLLICSDINHDISLGAPSTDNNLLLSDSFKDYYPIYPFQLFDGQVVTQVHSNFGHLSSQRHVFCIFSYDFLLAEKPMRIFLGLPLAAAVSGVTSSTEATMGIFFSTSTKFMGLRRKTRIEGISI